MGWKFLRSSAKAEPAPEAPAQQADGQADEVVKGFYRCREKLVSGWIIDLHDPQRKHEVEVFVGGKSIGTTRADRFDAVVQSHHGGDGSYAFALYYDGEVGGQPIESSVIDCESRTPLRSKLPLVKASPRAGPPLSIDAIRVGKTVEVAGRVGAYPWIDATLEFWADGQRVVSAIPIVGSETKGAFVATLEGEALRELFSGGIEIALPGLKEAGLAIPMAKSPLTVVVSPEEGGRLRVELRGEFEQTAAIEATLRLITDEKTVDEQISMASKVTTVRIPEGLDVGQASFEFVLEGVAIPAQIEWPLLKDSQFRDISGDSSPWSVSDNASAESGFFAFPEALADEHELSGYTAHLSRNAEDGPLRLFQVIGEMPRKHQDISIAVFARASAKAKLTARLRDRDGVLSECSATSRSSGSWHYLTLHVDPDRNVTGDLVFEVEATGRDVTDLDVALGGSRQLREAAAGETSANLLVNDGFHEWPHGAGVLKHPGTGEPCAGWTLFNRRCSDLAFTKAITHPADGSLGLALAAPHIKHYLRLETQVGTSELAGRPLLLRFRAGAPAAAKHLLAHKPDGIPQFTIIDPVQLIRRTRITTGDSLEERETIAGVFARKVPVSHEVERFEFSLPAVEDSPDEYPDDATDIQESYFVAFEFRHPTVIALFDVELRAEEPDAAEQKPPLKVEDRNIELQIETLQAVTHWRGPTPVRLGTGQSKPAPAPLKWGVGPVREPVTIVIPVYNALPETLACLDSLNGSTSVPILVSLIDDASDSPVREALVEYARDKPWVRVQTFGRNRGYTYAADHGIRDARTEWVVLLNSDTIVTRGWLEGLLACSKSDPAIAFVGPVSNAASYQSVPELYDASKKWKVNRLPAGVTPEDMAEIVRNVSLRGYPEVPLLNGFCTLMKRPVFIELGGLNPTAFPAGYGEENDLCLRATKAGVKLAVADDVYVYHVKSASFGDARRKELTKGGNTALQKLHPDVDIGKLTAGFRETPALVALRRSVAAELEKAHAPTQDEPEQGAKAPATDEASDADRKPQLQKA